MFFKQWKSCLFWFVWKRKDKRKRWRLAVLVLAAMMEMNLSTKMRMKMLNLMTVLLKLIRFWGREERFKDKREKWRILELSVLKAFWFWFIVGNPPLFTLNCYYECVGIFCSDAVFVFSETPFVTAPAGVQYFTGVHPGVTGVQVRWPGCTELTIKSVGVHPSQQEMQNLVGVNISALKSDWGALQEHEKWW